MFALSGIPPILGSYRERGVLRRLRITPMPPTRLLAALLLIHLAVAALAAVAILAIGTLAFDLHLPGQLLGWALAYLLCATSMLGLGVLVAAVSPNAKIANGVGAVLTFPLLFFAGLWLPRAPMPHLLQTISDYTPLGAAVHAMTAPATASSHPLPPWPPWPPTRCCGVCSPCACSAGNSDATTSTSSTLTHPTRKIRCAT